MRTLPVCYFPTTVVFIDDHPAFFTATEIKLKPETAIYKYFQDEDEILAYLQQSYRFDPFTKRCFARLEEQEFDHRQIELKIPAIYQEIYNSKRFEQISTVVVDYDMPSLNGLEVCKRITSPHIQKILLTGTGSETLAIQAFNQGLIHGYLRKQDNGMYEQLNQVIAAAQFRYFIELSQSVLESMSTNIGKIIALDDAIFIDHFQEFCQTNAILEYYLLDDQGSFLCIDRKGQYHGFYVYSEEKLEGFKELVLESDNIPEAVGTAVQQAPHILCYHSAGQDYPDEENWSQILRPAQMLQGDAQKYYIAIVSDIFDIDRKQAVSFANHGKIK